MVENIETITIPDSSHASSNSHKAIMIAGVLVLVVIASMGGYFVGKTNIAVPTPTPMPAKTLVTPTQMVVTSQINAWTKTNFGGTAYEYPTGWNVAYVQSQQAKGSLFNVLIKEGPINTSALEGYDATFHLTMQNGLSDPQKEFQDQVTVFKSSVNIDKEETLSSEVFNTIIHIVGKYKGPFGANAPVEKYFFMSDNPKYKLLDGKLNLSLYSAEVINNPAKSDQLKHIVLSVKECGYTSCEALLK